MENAARILEIPKTCPKCGHLTTIRIEPKSGVRTLWCLNKYCGESQTQNLSHFVSRDAMNIVGLSEETLRTLQEFDIVSSMSDILKLANWEDGLLMLEGFGERKVSKLLEAIETAKSVKLENFIYALGIPNVGLQTAKLIAKYCGYELETFRALDWGELINNIDGIGDTIATNVADWLEDPDNQEEMDEMLTAGLNIIGTDRVVSNSLAGKVFCCTGAVYQFSSRTELKNYIESQGGKLTGSVSNNTNYLITNDTTSGSTKNRTAAALGIPVITEAEFIERFGGK